MTKTELIAELTDICTRQAEIIKAQAYVLEQFGAQVQEEEAMAARNRLREMGCWEDEDWEDNSVLRRQQREAAALAEAAAAKW